MVKVLVGGIVGGIVVFMWGFVSHMLTPVGTMGFRTMAGEDKVLAAIKESVHEPAMYLVPGHDMSKTLSHSEEEAYAAKARQGPTGFLVIHPEGSDGITPSRLGIEFASSVAGALIAALILTQVSSGYFGRVLIVTGMGVFAFVSVLVSYWNWYGFTSEYMLGAAIDEIVGSLLAGLVLAAIIRPARAPKVEIAV